MAMSAVVAALYLNLVEVLQLVEVFTSRDAISPTNFIYRSWAMISFLAVRRPWLWRSPYG